MTNLFPTMQKHHTIASDKEGLKKAIASGCEIIIVQGVINMGDEEIVLHDFQKLVGENYICHKHCLSKIIFDRSNSAKGIIVGHECEISDLSLDLKTLGKEEVQGLICNNGKKLTLRNVDLNLTDSSDDYLEIGAIANEGFACTYLEGFINIKTGGSGEIACGIFSSSDDAKIIQAQDCELFITTLGCFGVGISGGSNLLAGNVNIITKGDDGFALYGGSNTFSGVVNIVTLGHEGLGIRYGNNILMETTKLMIETQHAKANVGEGTVITYSCGAQFGIKNALTGTDGLWIAEGFEGQKTFGGWDLTLNDLKIIDGWRKVDKFPRPLRKFSSSKYALHAKKSPEMIDGETMGGIDSAYNATLTKFDDVILSAARNGSNLLSGDSLDVGIDIKGVKADLESLGVTKANWKNVSDIEKSISELNSAILRLQSFSSKFSAHSSFLSHKIISIRKDFSKFLN